MDEPEVPPVIRSAASSNPRFEAGVEIGTPSPPATSDDAASALRDAEEARPTARPPVTGNDAVFRAFYRQFVPTLVAFLMLHGARLSEAAEISQETMIEAYKRWSEIQHPKAWAHRVASRMLIRRIASVGREDLVDEVPEPTPLVRSFTNVEVWEQRHYVLRVVDRLPPRQRQVMAWTLEGYTPSEIAAELKITSEAVRASLKKARHTLAAFLGAIDE